MEQDNSHDRVLWNLGERVKELRALHRTARILQNDKKPSLEILREIVNILPPAWQYPPITSARITFGDISCTTPDFAVSQWGQKSSFTTSGGAAGTIEIYYREECPRASEGPFLAEERELIDSLAEMLRSYFQNKLASEALRKAHEGLEQTVRERTAELREANLTLQKEISEHRESRRKIEDYQRQLRGLATELSLAEERERREIASDLHDHIGQALAFIKLRISEFQGNSIFCGFEDSIDEIISLLNQTIEYTRGLTSEISPPVLYELGLGAAIDFCVERFRDKYGLKIKLGRIDLPHDLSNEIRVVLYRSLQELLMNVVKHARASKVKVSSTQRDGWLYLNIEDNGCGFDETKAVSECEGKNCFGLFSIKERLNYLGGEVHIDSALGKGTSISLRMPLKKGDK